MQFHQLLLDSRSQTATIPPDWSQGRATFGGLTTAMLYAHLSQAVAADATLRSITFSFVAPVAVGPVEMQRDILRAGRSVTQVEARMSQNGQVVLAALASFGAGRASSVKLGSGSAPDFPSPDTGTELPYIAGVVPEFTRKFDYRITAGGLPFSASKERRFGGWVRFSPGQDSEEQVGIASLLALIDAWPPATITLLSQPAPVSSLTWTVEFIEPLPPMRCGEWWQYLAEVEQADDGYGVIAARLWSPQGALVAFSRQTVTVFG